MTTTVQAPDRSGNGGRHRRPPRVASARTLVICLAAISAANGAYELTLGSRVGDMVSLLSITVVVMGLVLAAFPIGLAVGGAFNAVVIGRWGTRLPLQLGALLCFSMLILIGVLVAWQGPETSIPLLTVLWGVAGAGCGMLDPAHGYQATEFTRRRGDRQWVQLFMIIKLLATAGSAGVATAAIGWQVPVPTHLIVVGALTLGVGLVATMPLPNLKRTQGTEKERAMTAARTSASAAS